MGLMQAFKPSTQVNKMHVYKVKSTVCSKTVLVTGLEMHVASERLPPRVWNLSGPWDEAPGHVRRDQSSWTVRHAIYRRKLGALRVKSISKLYNSRRWSVG